MKLPRSLDDLFENAAGSPGERSRRWEELRRACATITRRVTLGGIPGLRVHDLRGLSAAIDLHFFHAAYRASFDRQGGVRLAWRIEESASPFEVTTEHYRGPRGDRFDFVLFRPELAALVDRHLDHLRSLDGGRCRDVLDVLLLILAGCMLNAAAMIHAPCPSAIEPVHLELVNRLLPLELVEPK